MEVQLGVRPWCLRPLSFAALRVPRQDVVCQLRTHPLHQPSLKPCFKSSRPSLDAINPYNLAAHRLFNSLESGKESQAQLAAASSPTCLETASGREEKPHELKKGANRGLKTVFDRSGADRVSSEQEPDRLLKDPGSNEEHSASTSANSSKYTPGLDTAARLTGKSAAITAGGVGTNDALGVNQLEEELHSEVSCGGSSSERERQGGEYLSLSSSGYASISDSMVVEFVNSFEDRFNSSELDADSPSCSSSTISPSSVSSSTTSNQHAFDPQSLESKEGELHVPTRPNQVDQCTDSEGEVLKERLESAADCASTSSQDPIPALDMHSPSGRADLDHSKLSVPKHLAVIMDGNSRWAKAKGLPTAFGHERGVDSLLNLVKLSLRWGVRALTVYAFSTENWLRPKGEVDMLLGLFERVLHENLAALERENICLRVVGEVRRLPPSLQRAIAEAHDRTADNDALLFTIGVSYSGRQDLVQACQALARSAAAGSLDPADITEASVSSQLGMATESAGWSGKPVGDPDLLIRTSGEQRLSNFLLWQLAYTELYFTETLWPDFRETDFVTALEHFSQRERRFGGRR